MTSPTKVLHATAWYPPYGLGGTEAYVEALTSSIGKRGIESAIVLPRPRGAPERYGHGGLQVSTYPVNEIPTAAERDGGVHAGFNVFLEILKSNSGALYHQHSWTRGLGLPHLRAARRLGFRTVLTIHVASNLCLRGSMVRDGFVQCDGLISAHRCGACWASMRGAPRLAAEMISRLPISSPVRQFGRVGTALSARALGARKAREFQEMVACADHVVAVCQWLYDALRLNGVPREKLSLVRQGLARPVTPQREGGARNTNDPLRLVYLGRWHPAKGVITAARAVKSLSAQVNVELTLLGTGTGAEEDAYRADVEALCAGETRIRIAPPLAPGAIAEALVAYDAMVVPSQVLETGPLVVLEAQAAGLFVLGSRLGGIVELLEDGQDGVLLPPDDVAAWSAAIAELVLRPRPLARPRLVRSMDDVADEMIEVYHGPGTARNAYALHA